MLSMAFDGKEDVMASDGGGVLAGEYAMGVVPIGVLLFEGVTAGVLLAVVVAALLDERGGLMPDPEAGLELRFAFQQLGGDEAGKRGPRRLMGLPLLDPHSFDDAPLLLSVLGRLCTDDALEEFAECAATVVAEEPAAGLDAGLATGGGIALNDGTDAEALGLLQVER